MLRRINDRRKLLVSVVRATFRFYDTTPTGLGSLSPRDGSLMAMVRSDAQPLWQGKQEGSIAPRIGLDFHFRILK